MTATPNAHSLGIALRETQPEWGGGGIPQLQKKCRTYAPMVADIDDFTEDVCVGYYLSQYGVPNGQWDIPMKILEGSNHPSLQMLRVKLASTRSANTDRPVVMEYLKTTHLPDLYIANRFKDLFEQDDDTRQVLADLDQRLQDDATAQLPHSPYDPKLLEIVMNRYGYLTPKDIPYDRAQHIDWNKRLTVSQPYDHAAWFGAAQAIASKWHETDFAEDPYFINAIFYSRYTPQYLRAFTRHKLQLDQSLQLSPADRQEQLLCPIARLTRILSLVCPHISKNPAICASIPQSSNYADVLAEIEARDICQIERNGPDENLVYSPVETSLEGVAEDMANR
jgi:hypothetical protein